MAVESITDRLQGSTAVASLRQERHIVASFQEAGWQVTHGYYYRDPATGKYRELDVLARRYWAQRRSKRRNYSLVVDVVCEVKSIRDFHLVFAPSIGDDNYDTPAYKEWFGYHEKRLAATLDAAGATAEVMTRMLAYFRHACYARGNEFGRPYKLFIDPPHVDFRASAFRETNIGSDKELDNAVFWRSLQLVFAAIASIRESFLDLRFQEIAGSIAYARHAKLDVALRMAETDIDFGAEHVQVIHPVVVVDARMWVITGREINEITTCRFLRRSRDYPASWCDVVTMADASRYIAALSEYYAGQARKRRAY